MALRHLSPLTGASLLALALPAAAQDHSHHPAPPPAGPHAAHSPAADPHAGHAGHEPAVQQDPHAGHAAHGAMTSPLGAGPMSRDASGTSWQPDLGCHGGVHWSRGDWTDTGATPC